MVNVIAEYIPVRNQMKVTSTFFSSLLLRNGKLFGYSEKMMIMQAGENPLNLLKVQ
jgi:hypothetical protein